MRCLVLVPFFQGEWCIHTHTHTPRTKPKHKLCPFNCEMWNGKITDVFSSNLLLPILTSFILLFFAPHFSLSSVFTELLFTRWMPKQLCGKHIFSLFVSPLIAVIGGNFVLHRENNENKNNAINCLLHANAPQSVRQTMEANNEITNVLIIRLFIPWSPFRLSVSAKILFEFVRSMQWSNEKNCRTLCTHRMRWDRKMMYRVAFEMHWNSTARMECAGSIVDNWLAGHWYPDRPSGTMIS